MNCQSVKNKKAELHTIIDSAKPDIIMGNESWLTPDIKNSEIFPDSFDAIRKDRVGDAHGGVFIAFRWDLLCTETPELDTECEIVWCKLNIIHAVQTLSRIRTGGSPIIPTSARERDKLKCKQTMDK